MFERWSSERDQWINGLIARGISAEQALIEYESLGRQLAPSAVVKRLQSGGSWYPAGWKGSKWVVVDPTNLMSLPTAAACYVVIVRGVVVYIGQTANLRKRFYEHKFRFGYSNSIFAPWGECVPFGDMVVKVRHSDRYGDWAMRELRLIRRLQPEQNCHGSTKKRRVAS